MDFDIFNIVNSATSELKGGAQNDIFFAYACIFIMTIFNILYIVFGLMYYTKFANYRKNNPKKFGTLIAMTTIVGIALILLIVSIILQWNYFVGLACVLVLGICSLFNAATTTQLMIENYKEIYGKNPEIFILMMIVPALHVLTIIGTLKFFATADDYNINSGR